MTLRAFIRHHRVSIDEHIRAQVGAGSIGRLTDADREDWINNDESLYNWARSSGVPL